MNIIILYRYTHVLDVYILITLHFVRPCIQKTYSHNYLKLQRYHLLIISVMDLVSIDKGSLQSDNGALRNHWNGNLRYQLKHVCSEVLGEQQ